MSDDVFASVRGKARRPWPAKALCDYIDPEGSMGRPQVAAAIDVPRATFDLAFHEGLTDTWAVRAGTHNEVDPAVRKHPGARTRPTRRSCHG